MTKIYICRACSASSGGARFYRNITTHCAECWKVKVRERREANIDHFRAYDRARGSQPHRVAARKAYARTEQGKQALARGSRAWAERNREKRGAHIALGNAVRDGKVTKPQACQACGLSARLHGHHKDYTRPLDVIWLCTPCHVIQHHPREDASNEAPTVFLCPSTT